MRASRASKRLAKIVDRLRKGETLCKTMARNDRGWTVAYFFEPTNRPCSVKTAERAIASGLLAPNNDGLFGETQTWRAA